MHWPVPKRQYQNQTGTDFLTLFGRAFQEIDPNAKLAAIFGTVEFRDRINFNSSNEDVMKVLDTEIESAIANAFNILRTRIDRFGVVQPNITKLATRGRILIELPGQDDPQRVRELLQGTANLEFWETYENGEVLGYLSQANNLLREIQANTVKPDTLTISPVSPAVTADTTKTKPVTRRSYRERYISGCSIDARGI